MMKQHIKIGIIGIGTLFLLGLYSCKKEDQNDASDEFNQTQYLQNMRANFIDTGYTALVTKLHQVNTDVTTFNHTPNATNLSQLKSSFLHAYLAYQKVSPFDFGPALTYGLRGVLNTYPANQTVIENNITSGSYQLDEAGNIAANGLPAIDYLLFSKSEAQIIQDFTAQANRKQYLQDVAAHALQTAELVSQNWANGYGKTFEQNVGTAVGSSIGLLINAMVQDFERYTRDGKVGIPLGIRSLGISNPDKVEAFYSAQSNELLIANLKALLNTFNGADGLGLDDFLQAKDAQKVAVDIQSHLQQAISLSQQLNTPMALAVDTHANEVHAIYNQMQQTLLQLKINMPSALSVLITYNDSDGD